MLAVVTFLYKGWRSVYTAQHVNALFRMVDDHLTIPHRNVCITDMPDGINADIYPLWEFPQIRVRPGHPNNYRCLKLFDVSHEIGDQLLVLDLDILIRRNIDHLITDDDFAIIRGRAAPYNSSAYLLKGGAHREVWDSFDPETVEQTLSKMTMPNGARWVGSDQSWISYCIKDAKVWDEADGVAHVRRANKDTALVYYSGSNKPWSPVVKARWPNKYREYMRYLVSD